MEVPDILQPRLGGPPTPIRVEVVRALTEMDIINTQGLTLPAKPPAPIAEVTQQHHSLARLLADGLTVVEVSRIAGISTKRIKLLKDDPAFRELIEHYTETKTVVYLDVHQQLADVAGEAISEIANRLADPERRTKMADSTLIRIAESGLDRTGWGPSKTVKVGDDSSSLISKLKEAADAERKGKLLPRQVAAPSG